MIKNNKIGLAASRLILPTSNFETYSTIACDQYTSDSAYWENVQKVVGNNTSVLNCILPEIFLESESKEALESRIKNIHEHMKDFNVPSTDKPMLTFVERELPSTGTLRKGLCVCIDLETYDYSPDATTLIRATEKTVVSRIPPRLKVRDGAKMEFPHVLLLINDDEFRLFKKTEEIAKSKSENRIYDFDLMSNGGHITGYKIDQPDDITKLFDIVENQILPKSSGYTEGKPLLYSVGDGNHSLATAKANWELLKTRHACDDHPGRYALVELCNLADESSIDKFHPIHRLVEICREELKTSDETSVDIFNLISSKLAESMEVCEQGEFGATTFWRGHKFLGALKVKPTCNSLPIQIISNYLDNHPKDFKITDYIHTDSMVYTKSSETENNKYNYFGVILPEISRSDLFRAIASCGVLPRKSFSIGAEDDKRFYLEGRFIC